MNPLLGYGLINGVGSLASSLFNQGISYEQSKGLMDYQYQLQQQAIDKQNLYNSPVEQMKRLGAAGLNPNLVYGSGVDGNQSSAASPGMASRHGEMRNFLGDAVQAYNEARQLQQSLATSEQSIRESKAREALTSAKTLGVLTDNKLKDATLDTNIKAAAQRLAFDVARTNNTVQATNNMQIQANNLVEQGNLLAARTGLTKEQGLTEVVRRRALEKGIELTDARINQISHIIMNLDAGTALRGLEYEIKKLGFESTDELDQWLKEHPTVEMIDQIIDRVSTRIGQAFGGNGVVRRKHKKRKN